MASIPVNRTPGGDFSWLLLSFTYTSHGSSTSNPGGGHGHNIIAADYGMTNLSGYTTAPGGTFVSANLYCNSCHDPHNKMRRDSTGAIQNMVGNTTATLPIIGSGPTPHRLQGQWGRRPLARTRQWASTGSLRDTLPTRLPAYRFPTRACLSRSRRRPITRRRLPTRSGSPMASGPAATTRFLGHLVRHVSHEFREWHRQSLSPCGCKRGPQLGNEQVNYNKYVSSGNMTGTSATAYLSLAPFMTGSNTFATLARLANNTATSASTAGPGSSDQASCLSCHRAHASGWRDALRWNPEGEFITYVTSGGVATWPGTDTTSGSPGYADGMLAAQVQAAYYDRPVTVFGAFQRSLCNKCHAQD